jgi:ferredoxin-NADP reductase
MAERGATPQVPEYRRRALRAVRSLFRPVLPDDYLELIDPLWSTRELRGRIERIEPETPDSATVLIRPGHEWGGHQPGQYLRIGVVVDGIHHWRAYSLTSDPGRADGCIAITPKLVEAGKVSPYLVRQARPGDLVRLGGVEGTFVLPEPTPEKALFISAGSGITPIMSMLNSLHGRDRLGDVVHLHSARRSEEVIFGGRLRELAATAEGYDLRLRLTSREPRLAPADLDSLCPDWRERHAFVSGPAEMLAELTRHWGLEGDPDSLELERFQPVIGGASGGEGGRVSFLKSGLEIDCDGATPVLVAGERAGIALPFGCRMGICHTCVGELRAGKLRDLRTGEIHGSEEEMVRTCVNAPEGRIEMVF